MTYFINFNFRETKETQNLRKKGYTCINDIAVEQNLMLDKQLWRLFFRNPQLTDLIMVYGRWNNRIRDYAIYSITHGINVGIIDTTLSIVLKFDHIANLLRNDFASQQLLDQAYNSIWDERQTNLDRHRKSAKKSYMLKALKSDNLAYFNEKEESEIFQAQLKQIARVGDKLDEQTIQKLLPFYAFSYEFEDKFRQLDDNTQLELRQYLPYFQGKFKKYAYELTHNPYPKLRRLARNTWNTVQNMSLLESKDTLINFASMWANRYELPYPKTDDEAIYIGVEILFYIQNGIAPCRDLKADDLISYDHVYNDKDIIDIDDEEEVVALMFG